MPRPNELEYKFLVTNSVATRGTCNRLRAGATIWTGKQILVSGYNGSAPGQPHCDEVGHFMVGGHCRRTLHAEVNALLQAAKYGIPVRGCDIVVNAPPCVNCLMMAKNAGIARVFYTGQYANTEAKNNIAELVGSGIELIHVGIDWQKLIAEHVLRVIAENEAAFSRSRDDRPGRE